MKSFLSLPFRLGVTAIIAILSVVTPLVPIMRGEIRYWNPRRGYAPFSDTIPAIISSVTSPAVCRMTSAGAGLDFTFAFRLSDRHSRPGVRYRYTGPDGKRHTTSSPGWELHSPSGDGGVVIEVSTGEGRHDGVSTRTVMRVRAVDLADGSLIASSEITDGVWLHGERNFFTFSRKGEEWSLNGGGRRQQELLSFHHSSLPTDSIGFRIPPGGEVELAHIRLETAEPPREDDPMWRWSDPEKLTEALGNLPEGGIQGVWCVFDREMEESLLRLGGDYVIAILPDGTGEGFDIVYLDGAVAGGSSWSRGDCKGHLAPTPFSGIYSLTWLDATRATLDHELRAYIDSDGLLLFRFPYQNSRLRFGRLRSFR